MSRGEFRPSHSAPAGVAAESAGRPDKYRHSVSAPPVCRDDGGTSLRRRAGSPELAGDRQARIEAYRRQASLGRPLVLPESLIPPREELPNG